MKKLLLIAALIAFNLTAMAQNIQFHYDFGRSLYSELDKTEQSLGRPTLTTTVEMFRPDSYGRTFFFVDMDYSTGCAVHSSVVLHVHREPIPFALLPEAQIA